MTLQHSRPHDRRDGLAGPEGSPLLRAARSRRSGHGMAGAVAQPAKFVALTDTLRANASARRVLGRWRGLVAHVEDRWWGIRTESMSVPSANSVGDDAQLYVPLAYGQIRRVLRLLRLRPDDVVVDLGCGLGRVALLAARRRVRGVVGVEFDPELAEGARRNSKSMRGLRSPLTVLGMDAYHADVREATVLILFNPFGAATLRAVMARLYESLRLDPRVVRIAYVNPVHAVELDRLQWLERTDSLRSPRFRHTVSVWTTAFDRFDLYPSMADDV